MKEVTAMPDIKISSFWFSDSQNFKLYTKHWYSGNSSKGIVQIVHGMRESTEYYTEFCKFLVGNGYNVYMNDARGHGRSAGRAGSRKYTENSGYIGDDGINQMTEDIKILTDIIKKENPDVPVFLLGHSMGSVLSRVYISKYGKAIDGLLISGANGISDTAWLNSLLRLAEDEEKQRGRSEPAADVPVQMFAHFNDRFQPLKTGYEYMSRDEKMVSDAISSPYAKVNYRCGFYVDLLKAMIDVNTDKYIEMIPKDLPVFSLSGSMDQFSNYGEGIVKLFDLFKKHGLKNTDFIIYKDGRHEMLREINRRDVYKDIINWLDIQTFK